MALATLRASLVAAAIGVGLLAQRPAPAAPQAPPFDLEEATIAGLQQRMERGEETARSLTQKYLARIDAVDRQGPMLHSVIELNPDALTIADTLDGERRSGRVRGPLHGIPILIKDNIATGDRMLTTAGSLALANARRRVTPSSSQRLRAAGAIILGKTNLSEWANFRSTHRRAAGARAAGRPEIRTRSIAIRPDRARVRRWRSPRTCRGGDRHRDRRLDRLAVERRGARRDQADARAREPHRNHPDRAQPGHRRADGAHRRDADDPARCDQRQRSRDARRRQSGRAAARRLRGTLDGNGARTAPASASSATGCSAQPARGPLVETAIAEMRRQGA